MACTAIFLSAAWVHMLFVVLRLKARVGTTTLSANCLTKSRASIHRRDGSGSDGDKHQDSDDDNNEVDWTTATAVLATPTPSPASDPASFAASGGVNACFDCGVRVTADMRS